MNPYVLYHHIITSMGPNITFSHRIFGRQELRQWALTSAPGQTQVALRKNHWGREQKYYARWFCSNCSEGTCRFGGSVSYSSVAEQMTIRSNSVDTQGDWSRRSRSGTSSTLTRAMKLRIKQHMICCRPLRIYRQKEFYAIASRTWRKGTRRPGATFFVVDMIYGNTGLLMQVKDCHTCRAGALCISEDGIGTWKQSRAKYLLSISVIVMGLQLSRKCKMLLCYPQSSVQCFSMLC